MKLSNEVLESFNMVSLIPTRLSTVLPVPKGETGTHWILDSFMFMYKLMSLLSSFIDLKLTRERVMFNRYYGSHSLRD